MWLNDKEKQVYQLFHEIYYEKIDKYQMKM